MRKKANDTRHEMTNSMLNVGMQRCKQGGRADRKRPEDTRKVATSAFLSPRRRFGLAMASAPVLV